MKPFSVRPVTVETLESAKKIKEPILTLEGEGFTIVPNPISVLAM